LNFVEEMGRQEGRALRLARFFGTSAEIWTGLQADYDLRLARYQKERQIEREVEPLHGGGEMLASDWPAQSRSPDLIAIQAVGLA
jgi:hypothetical protein